jgi:magnesium-transporting ATPase (P-type)
MVIIFTLSLSAQEHKNMANIYLAKNNLRGWSTTVAAVVGFWLSATLLIDFTIMPSMYLSGMMSTTNFGAVGYTLFSVFNRIELICAAMVLSAGMWMMQSGSYSEKQKIEVGFSAVVLLAIALCYTFVLTPQMGGLAIDLHPIDGRDLLNGGLENLQMHSTISAVPEGMNQMHVVYWGLEALKITSMATLLGFAYRQIVNPAAQ